MLYRKVPGFDLSRLDVSLADLFVDCDAKNITFSLSSMPTPQNRIGTVLITRPCPSERGTQIYGSDPTQQLPGGYLFLPREQAVIHCPNGLVLERLDQSSDFRDSYRHHSVEQHYHTSLGFSQILSEFRNWNFFSAQHVRSYEDVVRNRIKFDPVAGK